MKMENKYCIQAEHREKTNGYKSFMTFISAINKPDACKKVKEKFGENVIIKSCEKCGW